MIRRPPRSTLFPYRRSSDLAQLRQAGAQGRRPPHLLEGGDPRRAARSEEHTSELQSQSNLVCRLLLEKKKKMNHDSRKRQNDCIVSSTPHAAIHVTLRSFSP